jgi:hypothetical protein
MSHPQEILFRGDRALPGREHLAGNRKFIPRAFAIRALPGPIPCPACNCEDGEPTGAETNFFARAA